MPLLIHPRGDAVPLPHNPSISTHIHHRPLAEEKPHHRPVWGQQRIVGPPGITINSPLSLSQQARITRQQHSPRGGQHAATSQRTITITSNKYLHLYNSQQNVHPRTHNHVSPQSVILGQYTSSLHLAPYLHTCIPSRIAHLASTTTLNCRHSLFQYPHQFKLTVNSVAMSHLPGIAAFPSTTRFGGCRGDRRRGGGCGPASHPGHDAGRPSAHRRGGSGCCCSGFHEAYGPQRAGPRR